MKKKKKKKNNHLLQLKKNNQLLKLIILSNKVLFIKSVKKRKYRFKHLQKINEKKIKIIFNIKLNYIILLLNLIFVFKYNFLNNKILIFSNCKFYSFFAVTRYKILKIHDLFFTSQKIIKIILFNLYTDKNILI